MNVNEDTYKPTIRTGNRHQTVLMLTADNVHDLEFFYPFYRFSEAGYKVEVATPKGGELKGKFGMKLTDTRSYDEVETAGYALLYIPGGKAPEEVRKSKRALDLVRQFQAENKSIFPICHGAQVLVTADIVKGRKLAAWPEVKKEIEEAGGTFVNEALIEDGNIMSARWPGDLPGHVGRAIEILETQEQSAEPRSAAR